MYMWMHTYTYEYLCVCAYDSSHFGSKRSAKAVVRAIMRAALQSMENLGGTPLLATQSPWRDTVPYSSVQPPARVDAAMPLEEMAKSVERPGMARHLQTAADAVVKILSKTVPSKYSCVMQTGSAQGDTAKPQDKPGWQPPQATEDPEERRATAPDMMLKSLNTGLIGSHLNPENKFAYTYSRAFVSDLQETSGQ